MTLPWTLSRVCWTVDNRRWCRSWKLSEYRVEVLNRRIQTYTLCTVTLNMIWYKKDFKQYNTKTSVLNIEIEIRLLLSRRGLWHSKCKTLTSVKYRSPSRGSSITFRRRNNCTNNHCRAKAELANQVEGCGVPPPFLWSENLTPKMIFLDILGL